MLYLFAGAERSTGVAPTLRRFSHQYHKGFTVTIEEWDICRGADNDLLNEEVQASLLRRVEAGEFCCVILTPPCASWSRAPWANPWGPRPLRTAAHPWGMPWLEGARLQKVADSNSMVRFCILILVAAKGHHPYTAVLVEHPEDLGATRAKPDPHVRPASIWQLPAIRDLVGEGYFTLVLYQCVLGAPSRKPTRLLTSLRGLRALGPHGWPKLASQSGLYLGPLPAACRCGRRHRGIIKKSAEDSFTTSQAAAYPPMMDSLIARAIFEHCSSLHSTSHLKRGKESEEEGKEHSKKQNKEKKGDGQRGQEEQPTEERKQPEEKTGEAEDEQSTIAAEGQISVVMEDQEQKLAEEQEQAEEQVRKAAEEQIERARKAAQRQMQRPHRLSPLKVHYKGKVRNFCDGLGKCSPGIRPAGSRGVRLSVEGNQLSRLFWKEVEGVVEEMDKKTRLRLIANLALGKVETSPFASKMEGIKERLDNAVLRMKKDPRRKEQDRSSAINFRRLKAWAELLGDEDSLFLGGVARTGVPLGVRGEIPLIQPVYDRKEGRDR